MPLALLAVAAAGTIYSAVSANSAAHSAARVDNATADYNARQSEAEAAQLDLDTNANIRTQREENKGYVSRQHAGYAAAGVLANSGSALDAQLTNVGRMEQQIQQTWVDLNQKKQQLATGAKITRLEGAARASADKAQGTLALVRGGTQLASMGYGAYQSGMFAGGGGKDMSGSSGTSQPMFAGG